MFSAASTLFQFLTQSSSPLFEGGVPLWLVRLSLITLFSVMLFILFPRSRTGLLGLVSVLYGAWVLSPFIIAGILLFTLVWFSLLKFSDGVSGSLKKNGLMWLILLLSTGLYGGLMNLYRLGWKLPRPSVQDLGISYLYLRVIHVTVDWVKGKLGSPRFSQFFAYIFYFPTMAGGPVERYLPFFEGTFFNFEKPWFPVLDLPMALRFIGGLLKIWICNTFLWLPYSQLWDHTATLPYSTLIQIYYLRAITFYLMVSGINDLILMFSKFMGIPLNENYHYPYFRRNLAHFWRNWHISLSTILRDYVYEPLGGRRWHQGLNYLLTFLFCAMWHVTSPAFVLWGLMHGFGMMGLRAWQSFWQRYAEKIPGAGPTLIALRDKLKGYPHFCEGLGAIATFHYVALTWLPFWGGYPQGVVAVLRLLGLGFLVGPILN
jgi:alginate O-acetyltransferase complex protein AlgI